MKKALRAIWNFLNEWNVIQSIIGILLVKYSYQIIQFTFPNIPWDARLNPGVDALFYFIQTVAIYHMAIGVVWREHKTDMPKLAKYFQEFMFENDIPATEQQEKRYFYAAVLIPAFRLLIFSLIALAVFP